MKSVVIERRTRRIAAGVVSASVILGFVACSGSSERRTSRDDGRGGDYTFEEAGASNGGRNGGGSSSQGGEPAADSAGAAGAGGDVGVAGEAGVGGQTSSGGQSFGGESAGGAAGQTAGGEGGDAAGGGAGVGGEAGAGGVIDPVCGLDMAQVGAYSLWCGKVNMHLTAQGTWTHDTDCTSGCNVAGVSYCQKFYPNATAIVQVDQAASGTKDWKNAGCADSAPDGAGIGGEYACCAPLP